MSRATRTVRARGAFLLAVVVVTGTACEPAGTRACDPVVTSNGGKVITITEDWHTPFDAQPGDRVDVLMVPGDVPAMIDRCDRMGGELVNDPRRLLWTCEGVDF